MAIKNTELFASKDGTQSKLFLNHIGGLQRYLAAALSLCAPNVNSYRRLVPDSDAPTNVLISSPVRP